MNKYERNNVVIVILLSLFFLSIAAVVYFIFFYIEPETNKNKIVGYIDVKDTYIINEIEEEIKDFNLSNIAKLERNINNFNIDLTNEEKLDIAFKGATSEDEDIFTDGVEIEDMYEYFKDGFLNNISFNKEDIKCSCGTSLFIYDDTLKKYVYNSKHGGHGGEMEAYNYYSKITNVKQSGKRYIVTMANLWYVPSGLLDEGIFVGYDSKTTALNKTDYLFKLENSSGHINDMIAELENNYDKYKDKMDKYIYTFEKQGDDYLLLSFEYKKV